MKRIAFILSLGAVLGGLAIEDSSASCKKGIAISSNDVLAAERIAQLDVVWYYNWGVIPAEGASGVEFVPMVWGPGKNLEQKLSVLAEGGPDPVVLAFNEPDNGRHYQMSVDQAADLWDELEGVSEYLSSPAPARFAQPWFERFMEVAEDRDLDVDFLAVHWYGPAQAERLLNWVDRVYAKYQKPVWITELGVADWKAKKPDDLNFTPADVAQFLREVLPALDSRPYVRRYAWFGGNSRHAGVSASRLFGDDGELTEVGAVYAAHEDASVNDCSLP